MHARKSTGSFQSPLQDLKKPKDKKYATIVRNSIESNLTRSHEFSHSYLNNLDSIWSKLHRKAGKTRLSSKDLKTINQSLTTGNLHKPITIASKTSLRANNDLQRSRDQLNQSGDKSAKRDLTKYSSKSSLKPISYKGIDDTSTDNINEDNVQGYADELALQNKALEDIKRYLGSIQSKDAFSGYDYINYRKYILLKYYGDEKLLKRKDDLLDLKQKLEQKLKRFYKEAAIFEKSNIQYKSGNTSDYISALTPQENSEKEYLKNRLDHQKDIYSHNTQIIGNQKLQAGNQQQILPKSEIEARVNLMVNTCQNWSENEKIQVKNEGTLETEFESGQEFTSNLIVEATDKIGYQITDRSHDKSYFLFDRNMPTKKSSSNKQRLYFNNNLTNNSLQGTHESINNEKQTYSGNIKKLIGNVSDVGKKSGRGIVGRIDIQADLKSEIAKGVINSARNKEKFEQQGYLNAFDDNNNNKSIRQYIQERINNES